MVTFGEKNLVVYTHIGYTYNLFFFFWMCSKSMASVQAFALLQTHNLYEHLLFLKAGSLGNAVPEFD